MEPAARISVTEVRNALRCPRVFALGRLTGSVVSFPVGSSCLGGAFHRLVDRFAQTVDQPPAELARLDAGATREQRRAALARWLLDFLVEELQRDPSYRSMPAEVDDLAEALRQLARHLAERASSGVPADAIRALVRAGERPVEARLPEASVVLHGRIDALWARGGGQLDVVEYKLTDEQNEAIDRAQVALYRELLRRAEGLAARPVVLRFGPMLKVGVVQEEAADALVKSELLPLLAQMVRWADSPLGAPATRRGDLCAACPVASACAEHFPAHLPARDDPPMAASRSRPTSAGGIAAPAPVLGSAGRGTDEEGLREAQAIQKTIVEELRKDGVAASSPECIVGPSVYLIPVARLRGAVSQLDKSAPNVVHRLAMGQQVEAAYSKQGATRQFVVKRKKPRTVLLGPLLEEKRAWLAEHAGRFVVGQRPDGQIVTGDLADSATPHLLVGGQAGSGKSWLLRSLVASLVHWHDPSALRITLLDPKRVTFNVAGFQAAIAAHLDGPLLYGIEDALPCIERFAEVMEERYELFERAHVSDLREYNQQASPDAREARHVVVIDEFQDLTVDKKSAELFCATVGRLGAKARAAGVHLILATQRPDRQTVPPALKANLGGKIALRVASAVNSRVILDASGAEELLGRGDLLADLGQGLVRAQAAVSVG